MPEVAEPPQTDTPLQMATQPPPPEPKKGGYKAGDWKAALDQLQKAEKESGEVDAPVEKPTETPKEEPKVEPKPEVKPEVKPEPDKPAAEKPSSPLDVVTADKKEEAKEEPDELQELDKVQKPVAEHWNKLKEIAKIQKQKLGQLEGKLSELEKTPKAQPEEILAIAKERDELKSKYEKQEEALKAINYQYSNEFQSMVADRDAHVAKIQARVDRVGGDTDKFMSALAMPDGRTKNAAIKEALAEVDTEDRTRIHTLLETLDDKNEKLSEATKNSGAKWDEIREKRNAEIAEEQAKGLKSIETTFSQIAAALPETVKTLREVPDDVPEAAEWNAEIKAARETAMRVLTPGGSDQKESMEIAIKGGRYDSLEKRYLALHKDWVERGKRLQEYDSGGPDFKGGDKPKSEAKLSPSQKFHKAMESLKATQDD